jgi:hypothetical protein
MADIIELNIRTGSVYMKIAVIDGQGGGLGRSIIERIRSEIGSDIEIIALGTNSLATSGMIKAGADKGATGENAIVVGSRGADLIIGPIAIILPDSMLGEITGKMAGAVAGSRAEKLLLPLNKCGVTIAGTAEYSIKQLIDDTIKKIKEKING